MDTLLRDLKPDNVVLSASGVAKLTDFGFGRFGVEASSGTWSFGVPAGSPGYVAPEVILQRNYDYSTLKKKSKGTELHPLTWFLMCGVLHGNFWEKNSFVCCVPKCSHFCCFITRQILLERGSWHLRCWSLLLGRAYLGWLHQIWHAFFQRHTVEFFEVSFFSK